MCIVERYRDDTNVGPLKMCIYGLKHSPKEWYSYHTAHLDRYRFAISNIDTCVLRHKSDRSKIAVYIDDLMMTSSR
jgi:hypothetical protein